MPVQASGKENSDGVAANENGATPPATASPRKKRPRRASMSSVVKNVARKTQASEAVVVPTKQLVTFELDREEYAAVITDLREIIPIPEIVPIPGSPGFIRGIVNLRGKIVVVIDLEKRFSLNRESSVVPKHIVIAEVEDSTFGIVVDAVTGVLHVPVSSIKPTPKLVSAKIHSEYLEGVAVLEGEQQQTETKPEAKAGKKSESEAHRLILILDIPKLLSEKELLSFGSSIQETLQENNDVKQ
jgi:purine-binding chemotaxis protein CheW